jgi:hypothetical protein
MKSSGWAPDCRERNRGGILGRMTQYGPTIVAQANARRNGREEDFEAAFDRFCDEWDRGTGDRARFELEYLLAVGTRA